MEGVELPIYFLVINQVQPADGHYTSVLSTLQWPNSQIGEGNREGTLAAGAHKGAERARVNDRVVNREEINIIDEEANLASRSPNG